MLWTPLAFIVGYVHDFVIIILIQCVDVCTTVSNEWSSLITASARDARHIYLTWTADTPSSLYVVQYRIRNTQVYTSSLEVSYPIACVHSTVHLPICRYHPLITISHN